MRENTVILVILGIAFGMVIGKFMTEQSIISQCYTKSEFKMENSLTDTFHTFSCIKKEYSNDNQSR